MVKKINLNISLDIKMMMSLNHYGIKLPQIVGYVKHLDNANKTMSFNASDNKLLKKYNKIWEKVSSLMNIKFDSEPVYGDKYVKKKIK